MFSQDTIYRIFSQKMTRRAREYLWTVVDDINCIDHYVDKCGMKVHPISVHKLFTNEDNESVEKVLQEMERLSRGVILYANGN